MKSNLELKKNLAQKIPLWREEISSLLKKCPDKIVSQVTVWQLFRGLRGVNSIVCDTSTVYPIKGLFIRDYYLQDLEDYLPEEIFYLLCTGDLPNARVLKLLQKNISNRLFVPDYVWKMIESLPNDIHPMVMLSMTVMSLQKESVFSKRYIEGMSKEEYWETTLEDALDLIAKVPILAAGIYRKKILKRARISPAGEMDLAANFNHMLGIRRDDVIDEFMRKFIVVHSDHEGGNVTANATRIVNSALSDLYYSYSAGINGLAGFLHGMANQDMVRYVLRLLNEHHQVPDDDTLTKFVWSILKRGKIFPGFGHAVLRAQDPRFSVLYNFGKKHWPDEIVFQVVDRLCDIVPPILSEHGKAKNPYPNIDAISGSMLYHIGIKEMKFYPVMFATALSLGLSAQLILNQALKTPIFRPRSVTVSWVKNFVDCFKD
jgi:citrate synthase